MRAFFDKYGFAIFWIIALTDFLLIYLEVGDGRYFSKPLLMPVLLCTVFSKLEQQERSASRFLISGALLAATAGDIFLLNKGGFTVGLACFLVTLILYTIYFFSVQKIMAKQVIPTVMCVAVLASCFSLLIASLWNYLDGFKIQLVIYSAFLLTMLLSAINVFYNRKMKLLSLETFIPGAALFALSDITLATNKFYFEEPFLNIAAMATYCGAQYYLCCGFIKELSRDTEAELSRQEDLSLAPQHFNLN